MSFEEAGELEEEEAPVDQECRNQGAECGLLNVRIVEWSVVVEWRWR